MTILLRNAGATSPWFFRNRTDMRAAKAKGLRRARRIPWHAVPNAAIPIVTLLGLRLGDMIAGSVVVEAVFARPGVGRLPVNAATVRALAIVQAIIILVTLTMVTANLMVDLAHAWLDPRQREEAAELERSVRDAPSIWAAPTISAGLERDLAADLVCAVAPFADVLAPHDHTDQNLRKRFFPPVWMGGDWAYPLGTDALGRDILSRLLVGLRISMGVALLRTLIVQVALNLPSTILLETALSFLEPGIQPPLTSLGEMLGAGRDHLLLAWWIAVIPGVTVFLITLSISLLGDWRRDALDLNIVP